MLVDWFIGLSPIWQALLAGLFTWAVTSLGASIVFFTRRVNRRLLDSMLGFASGVMIAIQIGGIGPLVPERTSELARLGMRAVLAGTLANLMTATIAGVLVG